MTIHLSKLAFPSGLTLARAKKRAKEELKKGMHENQTAALDSIAKFEMGCPWALAMAKLEQSISPLKTFMTKNDIKKIMSEHPYLTSHGMGGYESPSMTPREKKASFQRSREDLLTIVDECNKACMFLQHFDKRKTINYNSSTYGLKHQAERFIESLGTINNPYVSNGALMCASIFMGFDLKVPFDSPNGYINFSSRSPMIRLQKLKSDRYWTKASLRKRAELECQLGLPASELVQKYSDYYL